MAEHPPSSGLDGLTIRYISMHKTWRIPKLGLDSQTAVFAQQTLQNLPNHRVSGGILSDFGKSPTQVGVAVFGIAQALAFAVTQFAR